MNMSLPGSHMTCQTSNFQLSNFLFKLHQCSLLCAAENYLCFNTVNRAWVCALCKSVFFWIKMPCNTGNRVRGKQGAIGWHCLQDRKQCALVIGQRKYFAWLDGWRYVRACRTVRFTSGSRALPDVIVMIRIIMFRNVWPQQRRQGLRIKLSNEWCCTAFQHTHSHKIHYSFYHIGIHQEGRTPVCCNYHSTNIAIRHMARTIKEL